MEWYHYPLLFGAAALGGAINSVAGGGTLLTFPSLLGAGMLPIIANATSAVALWPGQISSLWNYRDEIGQGREIILRLAIPSLLGGLLGSYLLVKTDESQFKVIIPYLVLTATLLFLFQEPLSKWQKRRLEQRNSLTPDLEAATLTRNPQGDPVFASTGTAFASWTGLLLFQFAVAVYGGYFGAGIGILQLAAFGLMGFTNIHRMNGFKNINGLLINGVAIAVFISQRIVDWKIALLMALGAIVGGYAGAGTARKIGQRNVRKIVILIGFTLTLRLFIAH